MPVQTRLESDGADYTKAGAAADKDLEGCAGEWRLDAGRAAWCAGAVHAASAAADDRALPADEEGPMYAAGCNAPAACDGGPVSVSGRDETGCSRVQPG